ncbi:MAG: MATE family efflux transporter [Bacteroidales bacterium]|nr:MATE family efflux transporter [Bacteroidales bacterium]
MKPRKLNLRLRSLWSDIRESVYGTEQDFTSGRISRAILLLSIPMVLEMVMESVFALVDIFFVSRLGPGAVVTVGITESLLTVIYALAVGFAVGTTALISRRIGEKDTEGAAVGAVQAILAGIMMALVIGITGAIFSKDFLRLMGATPDIVESGYMYTRIMMGGNIVIMLLFIINAVFRSAGDAAISMRVLWIANIINIILDPCLIFGWGPFPELGIKGAAVATNIGRGLAVFYQLYLLFRGRGRVKILSKHLRFNFKVMIKLIRLSLGGIGQNIIATSSWIGMVRIIAVFGSNVLAGYTIAIRIIIFAMLPAWGLGNAAATLVGQNLGANKPGRAERSVWLAGYANMIFLGLIALFLIINPAFFIKLFIDNEQVINSGATCLQIVSYGFLFYGMGMIVIQAMNGAGDTITPTKINFFCFWLLEIPLAYLLAITTGMQEKGVYISIVVSESVMTLAGLYFFRLGKWKLMKI